MTMPADMPMFAMLRARMDMLGTRQRTLAENVANVSTPGYKPTDVNVDQFNKAMSNGLDSLNAGARPTSLSVTHSGHIAAASRSPLAAGVSLQVTPDSETTLDGNAVVVEEQMMKLAETRMDFETAVGLYSKGLALYRLAAKSPGR